MLAIECGAEFMSVQTAKLAQMGHSPASMPASLPLALVLNVVLPQVFHALAAKRKHYWTLSSLGGHHHNTVLLELCVPGQ